MAHIGWPGSSSPPPRCRVIFPLLLHRPALRYIAAMPAVQITRSIAIDSDEISETFVRSTGAGGQHVNTTDSAVQLRFDVANSPSLPEAVKHRLAAIAGRRMTANGVLILRSEGSRSQLMNRQEVTARLVDLIRQATIVPKNRKATKPTKASKTRRMDGKAKRGAVKSLRRKPVD